MASNQLTKSTGCPIRWCVDVASISHKVPTGRGHYSIGILDIWLKNIPENVQLLHVCIKPTISIQTYIKEAYPVASIKSLFVENSNTKATFTEPKYHEIDFTVTDELRLQFLNERGDIVHVDGYIIFELF